MNGFLNILKPPGASSAAIVSIIKRITGEKTGHAGTLDPEAAGVLPIMIGKASRLADYLPDDRKEYIAEIAFSGATDTQDAQGKLTEAGKGVPSEEELLSVIKYFIGNIEQIPPAFSALKLNGVPLYKAARNGVFIQKNPRNIHIEGIDLIGKTGEDGYLIRVQCSRGTYIRTLCFDIGQKLGRPAHMRFLLRTVSAGFKIKDSLLLEEITDRDSILAKLITIDEPIKNFLRYDVPSDQIMHAINGMRLPYRGEDPHNSDIRVYAANRFIGMAKLETHELVFKMVIPPEDRGHSF